MKVKFSDPLRPKQEKFGKEPWSFKCPEYDKRSSCFINAGCDYGIGHRQPVGHAGNPKAQVATMPLKSKRIEADEER